MAQLSHPYMTAGKSTALTIWTLASKVMSLLFNTLSSFAIALLPRRKILTNTRTAKENQFKKPVLKLRYMSISGIMRE